MRGLEALVAAASAAGRNNLQNGQIVDNLIDPALKVPSFPFVVPSLINLVRTCQIRPTPSVDSLMILTSSQPYRDTRSSRLRSIPSCFRICFLRMVRIRQCSRLARGGSPDRLLHLLNILYYEH